MFNPRKNFPARILVTVFVVVSCLFCCLNSFAASIDGRESAVAYYPLSVGNSWKYCPSHGQLDKASKCTTWTVQNVQAQGGKNLFTVWTYPSESDDDAMILIPDATSITELTSKHLILRTDKKVGESWDYPVWSAKQQKSMIDKFTLISVSECSVGEEKFDRCMTVDENDSSLGIEVKTTYAKNIGPIRYEYFHAGQTTPFSVLLLKERKLVH